MRVDNKTALAENIRKQLEKIPNDRRLTFKNGNAWICCPFHGQGREKTQSYKINLVSDKASIGSGYCFACGKKIPWNDFAEVYKLKKFKGEITEEHASDIFNVEDEKKLIGFGTKNELDNAVPWPKEKDWRGINGKLVNKIGGLMYHNNYIQDTQLYLPVNVLGEEMGGINCVIKRKKGQKAYFNSPGEWAMKSLFPYDYVAERNDGIIACCEGPRDALNLIQNGLMAIAFMGSERAWNTYKADLILALEPKIVLIAFDNDEVGQNASQLAYNYFKDKVRVKVLGFGDKKDPGELEPKEINKIYNAVSNLIRPHKISKIA